MKRWLLPTAVLALLPACSEPFFADGPLGVRARDHVLELRNTGPDTIHYFVAGRRIATLIDWIPCTDPATCPGVPPGETRRVPYSSIPRDTGGEAEVIIYWWHLVPTDGSAFQPDSLRTVVAGL